MNKGHVTYTDGQERDSLVDSPQGRDVDGLSTDGTLGTDSGRVFSGTSVDDSVNCNDNQPLSNLLPHRNQELTKNLDRVLFGDEVDDLESVLDDSDGHDLLTVVSAVHHETISKSQSAATLYYILAKPTHALTSRSTMGIRPLANCFLAYRPAVWAGSYCKIVTFDTKTRCVTHGRRRRG